MRKRTAFTLIELLVVVAIIAILMAILMPSLAKARAQAKSVQCMANLKQIGYGFQMYADENNGLLPLDFASFQNGNVMKAPLSPFGTDSRAYFEWGHGPVGLGMLMPYLGYAGDVSGNALYGNRPKYFLCASAPEYEIADPNNAWKGASVNPNFIDYIYLRDSVAPESETVDQWWGQWHFGLKLTNLSNRNLSFCMAAGGWNVRIPSGHMDGSNFLWGDSHVEHLARGAYTSTPNGIVNWWQYDDQWRH